MCLEHKQYWQCCMLVDSKFIDPCPRAQLGKRCEIQERIHPIGGYCPDCRRKYHKLEDDPVTSPMYTRNDNFDRPWDPPRNKTTRPQMARFSSRTTYEPEPDRGRRSTRSPGPESRQSGQKQTYSYYYTVRPESPSSSEDDCRRKKKHHRFHEKVYHDKGHSKGKYKKEHQYHYHDTSRSPQPMQGYRVASPRTIRRLQEQGLLPPLAQLQQMQMPTRSRY